MEKKEMKQKQILASLSAGLIGLGLMGTADAALVSRLGGQAYYDTVANLTWLADANAAQTSGYDADGRMTWQAANDWAAGLTVGGVSGWRLADTIDVGNDGITYANGNFYTGVDAGYNMTTHSELSNLYYNVLGNLAYYDTSGNAAQTGWGLQNTGPFSNVQSDGYWSAAEYAPNTGTAWFFDMYNGYQSGGDKGISFYGWAVQSGDVSAVPVPAAVWLFGSGLLGLIGVARRKSANI
jgi:hypothetical protein